jgi:hypothetical protein
MNFKKDDIISVITLVGEFVGKYVSHEGETITVDNPRLLIQSESGAGFAKGVCMTGKLEPKQITFNSYVYISETADEFVKPYIQATSGLII